jgi:multisubunit Na+/H+ antiporter MnhF subunit
MWNFGHSVREIERSHDRVVIEETATIGAVWFFGGSALGTLLLLVTRPRSSRSTVAEEAVGAFAVLFFALLALYASVRSTYTADRPSGQLIIERKILFSTVRTVYDAHTIDRVYVRQTQKGSGLYVRFKSSRNKRLSMSLEFISLEAFTVALNTTLYTHREP